MKHLDRRVTENSEVRMEERDGEAKTITGYAAVFNSLSQPMFGFREIIRPGAFKKTIREADVRALINHDPNYVLGRTSARTLKLSEDEKGLRYTITPPETSFAKDLMVSIQRGDITQSSFGFQTIKDTWTGEGEKLTRELIEVKLYDVSSVTFPAYLQTEVSVRSLLGYLSEKNMEELGSEEKRAICSVIEGIRALHQSEPDSRHSDRHEEPGTSEAAHLLAEQRAKLFVVRKRLELLLVG